MALIKCTECGNDVSDTARACPKCGAKTPKKKSNRRIWYIILAAMFLPAAFRILFENSDEYAARMAARAQEAAAAKQERENVKIEKFAWHEGGFGTVMIANFAVRNDNAYPIKDIKIKCILTAASGTEIGSTEHVIYDIVAAHKVRNFFNVSMGFVNSQAHSSSCSIAEFSK